MENFIKSVNEAAYEMFKYLDKKASGFVLVGYKKESDYIDKTQIRMIGDLKAIRLTLISILNDVECQILQENKSKKFI
jgi:hypothetical protein